MEEVSRTISSRIWVVVHRTNSINQVDMVGKEDHSHIISIQEIDLEALYLAKLPIPDVPDQLSFIIDFNPFL